MTGKDLLLQALHHKPVSRAPWVPFAGVHAASLTGYTASDYLQCADKMVESLIAVNKQYQPDGQPVIFDLQVEAEILNCDLVWAEKSPPTVATHPLATNKIVPTRLPCPADGRLPIILNTMRRLKNEIGYQTALFGLVCGPFTLASHLRGTEIFMDMFDDPNYVHQLVQFCAQFGNRIAQYYIDAGMDVIALVDPLVSQISPDHFTQFLAPTFTSMFSLLRKKEVCSSFFVCGDATRNIEVMCQTKPDSIFIDENINMQLAKKITDQYHITIGGNIPLSTVMLLGTQQDNMQYVLNMLDTLDHQNLIIAPGCDMPYDTPPENVVGIMQAIHDPEHIRNILSTYQKANVEIDVELPNYAALTRPLIEVITLDSASCPACTYMMNAVMVAKEHFGEQIDVVEYKIIHAENIPRVVKMGIKNLPAIVINGELTFSSLIPNKIELFSQIERRLLQEA
ncbi:MAG: uroporphyrinogen decarboxylase family protein [Candidatus Latescibacterota bacterium]